MYYVWWQHNETMETGSTVYAMTLEKAEDYIRWHKQHNLGFWYWMQPA